MKEIAHIILKTGKDEFVKRFHPWIFSGAIGKIQGNPEEGDIVEVYSAEGNYLATGFYEKGSLAVKLFSYKRTEVGFEFWKNKLSKALRLRYALGLAENAETNAYRLVFSEGDGLPGLVADYYAGTVVLQTHSLGMHNAKPLIVDALKEIYSDNLKAVFDKSADTMSRMTGIITKDGYLYGNVSESIILENGCKFYVDFSTGQKTGFFIDQRENREILAYYSQGRKVLNTFCYSGSFSVYALEAGAALVHSVDCSAKAIELTEKNIRLNFPGISHQQSFVKDAKQFLYEMPAELYDIIILDPPAFAKHHDVKNKAVRGYVNLNATALRQIKSGGLLFTFSCSQAVDRNMFTSAVMAAAIEVGRQVKILHHLSQPADHPISIYHPEGEYLKGLVLYVE
jgi:23S rRNA (cytosine1962-C5)-methyltransferase